MSVPPVSAAPLSSESLESVAAAAVDRARAAGAQQAEACVEALRSFRVRVLGGEIDSFRQSVTHGLGLRVMVDDAVGFVSSTDLRAEALDPIARSAVALARHSTPDPANRLAEPDGGAVPGDLRMFDQAVLDMSTEAKVDLALDLERIALAHDKRIRRTQGANVATLDGAVAIVNSAGVARSWSGTGTSLSVVPLADDRDGKQQNGAYGVSKRWLSELPTAEAVATEAARRAIARIGARTVPTARVPIVMHPDVAAAWIAEMYEAFSAEAVIKKSSWLTELLGQSIAAPLLTLVDDGRLAGGIGTSPYDGEGVPTRRNVLIDGGVCKQFAYDTYHAHRAGAASTGSASRSYSSLPSIGYHNLYIEAGKTPPETILRGIDRGFYLEDTGSFGFNAVTGDYSYQAQGFWIEKGEKAFPVDGVTVASNSLDMLRGVQAVGNDLVFEHSVAAPTLLIDAMTVSGAGEQA